MATMIVMSTLLDRIKVGPCVDKLMKFHKLAEASKYKDFVITFDNALRFVDLLCAIDNLKLKRKIMKEVHETLYFVHRVSTKMYHDLKKHFWVGQHV